MWRHVILLIGGMCLVKRGYMFSFVVVYVSSCGVIRFSHVQECDLLCESGSVCFVMWRYMCSVATRCLSLYKSYFLLFCVVRRDCFGG